MNPFKRFVLALGDTVLAHWQLAFNVFVVSELTARVSGHVSTKVTGSPKAPTGNDKLASYRKLRTTAEDGCVRDGEDSQAWAKYAIPKGLPGDKERRLAIENDPHHVDDFDGEITAGYGKGTKRLLNNETVVVKVNGETFTGKANYHHHDADVAGPHYDLVIEGIEPGTPEFEVNIPRGEAKGRYAFRQTDDGTLIIRMCDRSVLHPKPAYRLKSSEFFETVRSDPDRWIVERKYDGALSNVRIHKNRAIMRSHRETGEPYYDKMPATEFFYNRSRLWSCRKLFPGPDLEGTEFQAELVHLDGSARVSGILNAHPEHARRTQELRGDVEVYVWDIKRYKGKDVSELPYGERRALYEAAVEDIRLFNKNWHVVEALPADRNHLAEEYYEIEVTRDPRGLPFSEGVVVKDRYAASGEVWVKIKHREYEDFVCVEILPSPPGTKYENSMAVMVVEDPITGRHAEVGSFAVTDSERQWCYDHREELKGATAKILVMEKTEAGAPRGGVFHGWHGDSRQSGAGSEMSLQMYAEPLAGMDPEESEQMVYRLKSSAGWRK